jgi:hypothetical protein
LLRIDRVDLKAVAFQHVFFWGCLTGPCLCRGQDRGLLVNFPEPRAAAASQAVDSGGAAAGGGGGGGTAAPVVLQPMDFGDASGLYSRGDDDVCSGCGGGVRAPEPLHPTRAPACAAVGLAEMARCGGEGLACDEEVISPPARACDRRRGRRVGDEEGYHARIRRRQWGARRIGEATCLRARGTARVRGELSLSLPRLRARWAMIWVSSRRPCRARPSASSAPCAAAATVAVAVAAAGCRRWTWKAAPAPRSPRRGFPAGRA